MSSSDLFVTGTDTNVGKTVLSALLCAALGHVYWKPIQTGTIEGSDRETVMQYAGIPETQTIPEGYRFEPPVSPHLAASMAGMRINLSAITRPAVASPLVIEGAGGVLVPVNERELMVDVMRSLSAGIILATRTSLGTINHTLLSIDAIRSADLPLIGVVMIGDEHDENRHAIEHYGNVRVIGHIPLMKEIHRAALLDIWHNYFTL